jgi:hypothetical protein
MGRKKATGKPHESTPSIIIKAKLPVSADSRFIRRHTITTADGEQHSGIFIDRVYAKGGFVITEYTDVKKDKQDTKFMSPGEAARRGLTLSKAPKNLVQDGLVEAIMKAAYAARQQTLHGANPLFELNKQDELNPDELIREIEEEIRQARRNDPELDEEMSRIELGALRKARA